MADFETARRRMVDNQLRTANITDRRLLTAMGEIERERYVPENRRALAYADTVHQLGAGRALASPAPFAKLVQLADIESTDSVLDVGVGTGYSSAVLGRLAAHVTALESDPGLADQARVKLADTGATNVRVEHAALDGSGQHEQYDVVVVEGAVGQVPEKLLSLLKDGGRLVALVQDGGTPSARIFVRSGDEITHRIEFNTSLPPLASVASSESFVF
jgi:protein-L-isoaspartate(D-aspartate) O-methyltransferase